MSPRIPMTVLFATALVLPLAFGPTFPSAEERIADSKAERFHAMLEAQKAERIAGAMSATAVEAPVGADCTAGFAGPYPCQNVDLASVVPLAELGGAAGNDSWGWTDEEHDREIALVGTGTGVAFVDVTDPTAPDVLGRVNSVGGTRNTGVGSGSVWRDVKVDDDHAYIVSEVSGHGLQVVDLRQLRNVYGSPDPTRTFETVGDLDFASGSAHNIAVNEETDTAFIVGTSGSGYSGGLLMVDISDPSDPKISGFFAEDGYTHDVQCIVYDGPDDDYNGNNEDAYQAEICFASNEDTVTIVDVTNRAEPEMINRIGYASATYTHQGWLTPDREWFVFNDELDEQVGAVDNTTTYMVNVSDLDADLGDAAVKRYTHDSLSTDHNLYITDDGLIWQANYNQGLRVLKEGDGGFEQGDLVEVGYFEVDSVADAPHYGDSWNVYPFFESGTVIVSNIGQGLVVLAPDYDALHAAD